MLHSTSDEAHRFATAEPRISARAHRRRGARHRAAEAPRRARQSGAVLDARGIARHQRQRPGAMAADPAREGQVPEGGRLFSEESSAEMWTPQTIEPIGPALPGLEEMTPNFQQYALGWEVRDYGGARIIWHSGGVFGFVTVVVLIPEKNVGFAITQNSEDGQARFGLMYELLDHYLGRPKKDWPARITKVRKERFDAAVAAVNAKAAAPVQSKPTLPLAAVCRPLCRCVVRRHRHRVRSRKGLTINFTNTPNMGGRLQHWQYDTFIARFDDTEHRTRLRDVRPRRRRQGRADHDEAGLAARGFQLRLSGPAFHAGSLTCARYRSGGCSWRWPSSRSALRHRRPSRRTCGRASHACSRRHR